MFETYGALIALVAAIVLIIRKVPPAYALVFGALAGGLCGGGGLSGTVGISVKERLKLFPYGALVGLASTAASIAVYVVSKGVSS